MAIRPCRECGKDVSTGAQSCPHCGVPIARNKTSAGTWGCLVLVILVAAIAIPGIMKSGKEASSRGSGSEPPKPPAESVRAASSQTPKVPYEAPEISEVGRKQYSLEIYELLDEKEYRKAVRDGDSERLGEILKDRALRAARGEEGPSKLVEVLTAYGPSESKIVKLHVSIPGLKNLSYWQDVEGQLRPEQGVLLRVTWVTKLGTGKGLTGEARHELDVLDAKHRVLNKRNTARLTVKGNATVETEDAQFRQSLDSIKFGIVKYPDGDVSELLKEPR